ncbi:MAG TPA: hypothetical protein VNY73_03440 [Bacteroidia bacterium]|jgi:hypothetical protein|nr:hypothetical protein [Bacteroidia bacterium]
MKQLLYKTPRTFSIRKVSVDQAIKMLRRNGIQASEEQTEMILDFLYLIAKTYNNVENQTSNKRTIFRGNLNTPMALPTTFKALFIKSKNNGMLD